MIFIYEAQDSIPTGCKREYKVCYPLKDAKNQYQFLHSFDWEALKGFDEIWFLNENGFEKKIYSDVLKDYSTEINNPTHANRLTMIYEMTLLPSRRETENLPQKNKIELLIQQQKFVDIKDVDNQLKNTSSDTKFVVYTNYKKNLTKGFIKKINDVNRLELYYNATFMYSKEFPVVEKIDSKEYFEIEKKLNEISAKFPDNSGITDYYYKPNNFVNIIRESIQSELQVVRGKAKTRLKILGEDRLLYSTVIAEIVSPHRPIWYDLKIGVPYISSEYESLVLQNFDSLGEEGFRNLDEAVRKVNQDVFVILQTFRKRVIHYFEHYYEVELPDKKKINDMISTIFASFILDIEPYREDYYKLKPLIQSNALRELLSEMSDLSTLQKVMNKFNEFHFDKILTNTDMWYYILKALKPRKEVDIAPKEIVNSEFRWCGNTWEIYGLSNSPIQDKRIGISSIAIIIAYCNQYQKPIGVSLLRDILIDLFDDSKNNINPGRDFDADRKTIQKNIKKIRNNPHLDNFCNQCIVYEKWQYYLKENDRVEYKIQITHPKLTADYLRKYHK